MEFVGSLKVFNEFATQQVNELQIHKTEGYKADDVQKAIGGKAVVQIVDGGNSREIKIVRSVKDRVWFTGRDGGLKENNNTARKMFLQAVLDQYEGKWENVPKSVRDQLELGDYKTAGKKSMLTALDGGLTGDALDIDSGKPLTARRIKAVIAAIETEAQKQIKAKTPQEVSQTFLGLMQLPCGTPDDAKLKLMKMQNLLGAFFDKCTKGREQNFKANTREALRNTWIAFAEKMINSNGSVLTMADLIEVTVGGKADKTSMESFLEMLDRKISVAGFGRLANQVVGEIKRPFQEFIEGIKASFNDQKEAVEKQMKTQFLGDLKAYYDELDKLGEDKADVTDKMAPLENVIKGKYKDFPNKLAAARKLFGRDFLAWIDRPLAKGLAGTGEFLDGKTPLKDAFDFAKWHSWKFYFREQKMWPQDA